MSKQLAQGMWRVMVTALEAVGGIPVAFRDDVYKTDRKSVGAIWAPDSTYVWLVREHGSHLSRVGVVDPEHLDVHAALRHFGDALRAQRFGVWKIRTNALGEASATKVTVQQGLDLCGRRSYSCDEGLLKRGTSPVCVVQVNMVSRGPGVQAGVFDIRSAGKALTREEVLAGYQVGLALLKKRAGLFAPVASASVDGKPIEAVAPVYEIDEELQCELQMEAETQA